MTTKTAIAPGSITETSRALFLYMARDADNWDGQPLLWVTAAQRGNVTQLKKAGLITTFADQGCNWVDFTPDGVRYAADLGVTNI